MREQPIYTERHSSFGALALISVSIYAAYLFIAFYYGTPELWGELWDTRLPIALWLGFGTLCLVGVYASSVRNWVELYPDRIESHTGKRRKIVRYKEIVRAWKGRYSFSSHGSRCFADDYPGVRFTNPSETRSIKDPHRPAEILVWNAYTSKLGFSSVKDTPLILERHNLDQVTVLHVKDEAKAIAVIKKHAPWIKWSPVLGPMTRDNIRGPIISN